MYATVKSVSLYSIATHDETQSINFDSEEKARRATPPVEVVPPLGSGWSILKPVFSCTRVLTKTIEFFTAFDVGDHVSLPQFILNE